MPELEQIAEQDEPIGPLQCSDQPVQGHRLAQHITLGVRAQVQIGDDQGAQRESSATG
jgi:hypothetical protein